MHFTCKNALVDKAKELRRNMTPEESKLWFQYLRTYPVRFLRQKVIDTYILDFYCSKARLCIEIDGLQHLSIGNTEHDVVRAGKLSQLGILTIRLTNDQVNHEFAKVCSRIDRIVHDRLEIKQP